jgi:hypothetical protein
MDFIKDGRKVNLGYCAVINTLPFLTNSLGEKKITLTFPEI